MTACMCDGETVAEGVSGDAHFPCLNVTGDLLFDPFWEAIFRLERRYIIYFTVIIVLS